MMMFPVVFKGQSEKMSAKTIMFLALITKINKSNVNIYLLSNKLIMIISRNFMFYLKRSLQLIGLFMLSVSLKRSPE